MSIPTYGAAAAKSQKDNAPCSWSSSAIPCVSEMMPVTLEAAEKLPFSKVLRSPNMRRNMVQYFCSNFTFFFCLGWLYPLFDIAWMAEQMFRFVPAMVKVAAFKATFEEFPQRQKPGSFSLDRVLEELQEGQPK